MLVEMWLSFPVATKLVFLLFLLKLCRSNQAKLSTRRKSSHMCRMGPFSGKEAKVVFFNGLAPIPLFRGEFKIIPIRHFLHFLGRCPQKLFRMKGVVTVMRNRTNLDFCHELDHSLPTTTTGTLPTSTTGIRCSTLLMNLHLAC